MKGYPTILKRSQTRLLKRYRSKTYLNACWVPVFQGSKEYVLDGDEVKRGLKSIYRIVWNISHRNAVGKVQKKQTHIASIQHWNVVDEFKEFLQYRQGRIENDSIMWTKANIHGNVPDLKNAIAEFLEDLGSDISIDGQIYDAIEKKLANVGDSESSDTANFISKINLKWYPVKKLIITDYVGSEEFQVWLSNEAMRKAGPRKSTKQELRDQKEFEGKFDSFKESFRNPFGEADANSDTSSENEAVSNQITNRELALEIVKAGFKGLAKIHHPDVGGDTEKMKELIVAKDQLTDFLS
jgi:hypothetical protein